ncbi:MAG TPA: flagellar basal-body MS-ring/collar protein FliF, partial [Labilithrix sp.]|nr:flagellar basal-body MS-ring/collar protein FliF [Labilithrix sp.]
MSDKRLIDSLPAPVRPLVEKVVAGVKGLSRPAKIVIVTTTLVLVAFGAWSGFRSSNPPYAVLFNNLDRDDAAAVVAKLKEMKVPYRLEGDGSVIEVPEEKAREVRLELAGGGLPRGGAVGFESFDKMRLGATDFEQRLLYRRALEGELARTIGTVAAVQTARVHLVLPEKSVFVSKNEPSSASVVLKLRGGRALGGGEVSGIVHLVSTSVAGLSPDHVAIVTTEGAVLHKPRRQGEDGANDDDRASHARALEATLEERARAKVEKVTGAGHADVRVTVDIDPARVERVEDHYDPAKTALRSEERNVERAGEEIPVAGVPGAESNLPGGAARGAAAGADGGAPVQTAGATGTSRESHTRNFEVDRITEKRTVA